MKKWVLLVSVVFLGFGLILAGCAKPTAELEKAESALQEAKDAGAPQLASADYNAAENKLNEGKKLIDEIKYSDAKTALEESAQLSALAKQKALAAKKGPEPKPVTPAPVVTKKVDLGPGFTEYAVSQGDCLWNISRKGDIYGDAFQWPLIYDNNKDQIKNPDLIYPKQVLKIKRNATEDEIKAAKKKAGVSK